MKLATGALLFAAAVLILKMDGSHAQTLMGSSMSECRPGYVYKADRNVCVRDRKLRCTPHIRQVEICPANDYGPLDIIFICRYQVHANCTQTLRDGGCYSTGIPCFRRAPLWF